MSLFLERFETKSRKHVLFDRVFRLAESGLCDFPEWEESDEDLEAKLEIAERNERSKSRDSFIEKIYMTLAGMTGGENVLIPYEQALETKRRLLVKKGHKPIRSRKDLFKHICSSYYDCPSCNLYSEK